MALVNENNFLAPDPRKVRAFLAIGDLRISDPKHLLLAPG
jgi:hypothetical protein